MINVAGYFLHRWGFGVGVKKPVEISNLLIPYNAVPLSALTISLTCLTPHLAVSPDDLDTFEPTLGRCY